VRRLGARVTGIGKTRLSPAAQAAFDRAGAAGLHRLSERLGLHPSIIDGVLYGGSAKPHVIERIEAMFTEGLLS
jgi:hypothetical protein